MSVKELSKGDSSIFEEQLYDFDDLDDTRAEFLKVNQDHLFDNNMIINPLHWDDFSRLFLKNQFESNAMIFRAILNFKEGEDILIRKIYQQNTQSNLEKYSLSLDQIDQIAKSLQSQLTNDLRSSELEINGNVRKSLSLVIKRTMKIYKSIQIRLEKNIKQTILENDKDQKQYLQLCQSKIEQIKKYIEDLNSKVKSIK